MKSQLRVALAQIDPIVGAFADNVLKIKTAYLRACADGARILVTPELSISGYSLYDLIERPEFFTATDTALAELMALTQGQSCALVVGHLIQSLSPTGRAAQNVASVLDDGRLVFRQAKSLLPTYDVFDEARYFEAASEIQLWTCEGVRIAIAICEDLWGSSTGYGCLYGKDPVSTYASQGADLVISLAASPYEYGKSAVREQVHADVAKKLKVPLVYVNQVGATDEVLFDGGSFVLNSQGQIIGQLPFFEAAYGLGTVLDGGAKNPQSFSGATGGTGPVQMDAMEVLTRALVTGIREYFHRTGNQRAVLGLSGGIDSAVVAALAVEALGKDQVLGVAMPSQFSSSHSLEDATALAQNLGIRFEVRPIKFLYATAAREIADGRGQLASLSLENLQTRLRGVILMTLSNHDGSLLLTTGNKSEIATGYCTLYGDMAGALAPIGDLYKQKVYELARYLNQRAGKVVIPQRTITKPPSAELKPNQTDQDTLPPYDLLDQILFEYLEKQRPASELFKLFPGQHVVIQQTLKRVQMNEYKRRQAPPILKVSAKAFGIGRRLPLAVQWP